MNKHAYFMGYIFKAALTEGATGSVWTGYTDGTPVSNEDTEQGEDIYNEGTPYGIKDYAGGGSASIAGLPKGAAMQWPVQPPPISPHSINDPTEKKFLKAMNSMPKTNKIQVDQGTAKPSATSFKPAYNPKGGSVTNAK